MFSAEIYQLCYQALLLILILSGPPIIISMALGLFVAIFQAATQIQEQT
ncbi:MAG TPA: flagellar biosynthetic protein FliQ, partial [Rhabdochlamydiaceae bacterium]